MLQVRHVIALDVATQRVLRADDEWLPWSPDGMLKVHGSAVDGFGIERRHIGQFELSVETDDPVTNGSPPVRETYQSDVEVFRTRTNRFFLSLLTRHSSLEELRTGLGLICHNRESLRVAWTASGSEGAQPVTANDPLDVFLQGRLALPVKFGQHVHQMVELRLAQQDINDHSWELVGEELEPTDVARQLLFRARDFEIDRGLRRTRAGIFVPPQINRWHGISCVVGRGVSAYVNSRPSYLEGSLFVVLTHLSALSSLRDITLQAQAVLAPLRPGSDRTLVGSPDSPAVGVSTQLRDLRLRFADEVATFVNVTVPETIVDEVRRGFAELLAIRHSMDSAHDLLETIAQVADSYRLEEAQAASAEKARRHSRWGMLAAILSAATLPLLILLAYFGVGSSVDLDASRSIFDLDRYRGPWLVFAAMTALLLLAGTWASIRRSEGTSAARRVAIAAHGCNDVQTAVENVRAGADIVEFDAQLADPGNPECGFVARHAELAGEEVDPSVQEVLSAVGTRASIQVDIKFDPSANVMNFCEDANWFRLERGPEVSLVRLCRLHAIGTIIVTTRHRKTAAAISAWKARHGEDVEVGLSIGGGESLWPAVRWACGVWELIRSRRTVCDFYAVESGLARWGGARLARLVRRRVSVWPVNTQADLERWMSNPNVWFVTTDSVTEAVSVRRSIK